MRLRHPDGSTVHLAYCTNVHPAEDLTGIHHQLAAYGEPVRDLLGTGRLGLGLWLPHDAASTLDTDPAAVARLRAELTARGLEVVTLNGFPYRGFHEPVVKRAVYAPDWTDPRRLEHTLRLARVLAALLPDDAARASISTLPLGWRTPWTARHRDRARHALDRLAEGLAGIAHRTGRHIRVGLEPEPGCAIATVEDACTGPDALDGVDTRHIGVCLDVCHLAADFEEPRTALRRLDAAGLPVVKAQLSSALQADAPADPAVRRALETFREPRFLHQTRARALPRPHRWDDLADALDDPAGQGTGPWRVHFHIPVHTEPEPPLTSTRSVLAATLRALAAGPRPVTDHLEVETYTWSVLPGAARPTGPRGLAEGIAAELDWVRGQLRTHGLREETP
ncbi:metabolite traffic protein EboE [Streptomyces sp. NPDC046261]|uniref:metabolite traffic protein EboE n=1 Tax=Streptomyces sp. NPDC046261 TaxID=3157200 RepID=UPI0033D69E6D